MTKFTSKLQILFIVVILLGSISCRSTNMEQGDTQTETPPDTLAKVEITTVTM